MSHTSNTIGLFQNNTWLVWQDTRFNLQDLWQNTGLFGHNTCLFWQELGFFWYLPHRYPDWMRHGDTWMRNPSCRLLRSNAALHGGAVCCSQLCHIVFRAQAKSYLPSLFKRCSAVCCGALRCVSVCFSVLQCAAVRCIEFRANQVLLCPVTKISRNLLIFMSSWLVLGTFCSQKSSGIKWLRLPGVWTLCQSHCTALNKENLW